MFNFWRKHPKRKPKHAGFYLCTVTVWDGENRERSYIDRLYFTKNDGGHWIDSSRQAVFDEYKTFKYYAELIQEVRVFGDPMCDLTDKVTAWKKLPRVHGKYRREVLERK